MTEDQKKAIEWIKASNNINVKMNFEYYTKNILEGAYFHFCKKWK